MKTSKTKLNSRGFGHIEFLLLAVVIVIVVGAGMWVWEKNSGPKLTSAQKTVQTACLKDYNDKRLCDFDALWITSLAKIPYTMIETGATSSTIKNDGKGNFSITTTSGDVVSYNSAIYVLAPGISTWVEYAAGSSGAPNIPNPASSFHDLTVEHSKGYTYAYEGTVKCGSLTCYKFQGNDPTKSGTTAAVWFDTKHYQLQGGSSKDGSGNTYISVSYNPVTITAPTPAISSSDLQ